MIHYSFDALMLEDKVRKPIHGGGTPHGLVVGEKSSTGVSRERVGTETGDH